MRILLAALLCSTMPAAADNMKAFPPAEPGMVRYVLQLPEEKNEDSLKVELIVGKTVKTDGVNHHFFAGKVEEVNIEGWGFTRYVLKQLGPMAGTLIGVEPGRPMVDTFVTVGGGPNLLRYNSRLPLVVYVPEGVEVRYRVWRADPEAKAAPQG